jgi:hypothetical protein
MTNAPTSYFAFSGSQGDWKILERTKPMSITRDDTQVCLVERQKPITEGGREHRSRPEPFLASYRKHTVLLSFHLLFSDCTLVA